MIGYCGVSEIKKEAPQMLVASAGLLPSKKRKLKMKQKKGIKKCSAKQAQPNGIRTAPRRGLLLQPDRDDKGAEWVVLDEAAWQQMLRNAKKYGPSGKKYIFDHLDVGTFNDATGVECRDISPDLEISFSSDLDNTGELWASKPLPETTDSESPCILFQENTQIMSPCFDWHLTEAYFENLLASAKERVETIGEWIADAVETKLSKSTPAYAK